MAIAKAIAFADPPYAQSDDNRSLTLYRIALLQRFDPCRRDLVFGYYLHELAAPRVVRLSVSDHPAEIGR